MFLCYARVSTVDQADVNASSLPEQLRKGKAVATLRGAQTFDWTTYTDEGVSGSVPLNERPSGSKMMEDARPGDCIISSKMDRLFRSTLDAFRVAEFLKEKGIDLILADISAEPITGRGTGKLFFGLLAVLAEFERERIAERTMEGRRVKAEKNGHLGGPPPYGYQVVGVGREARVEPHPGEMQTLEAIKDIMHKNTPAAACKVAAERGLRSRAGTPFQIVQLQRIAKKYIPVEAR